jgi:hypothetical protein
LTCIRDAVKGLQDAIESGQIIELGKKCREKNLTDIMACYEEAYGKIPTVEPKKAEGGQGCCVTF